MAKLPIEVLPDLDAICGVPLGHILRVAGYVADDHGCTVEEAVRSDPGLTPRYRRELLSYTDYCRARSAEKVAQ